MASAASKAAEASAKETSLDTAFKWRDKIDQ